MDGIYGWIRNLTGFFLFMSVIDNLLPNKKYGKYVRLFSGMILILLVLQPLTGSLRLEDKIAHYYESFVFRYQAEDLQSEILGIEKQRLTQMIAQYEHAVEQDVGQMAEDMGFSVRECSVTINGEEGTEQFGTVTGISLRISAEEGYRIPSQSLRWSRWSSERRKNPGRRSRKMIRISRRRRQRRTAGAGDNWMWKWGSSDGR